jgi:hypothetical protein
MQSMADIPWGIHCDAVQQWFDHTQRPGDSVMAYSMHLDRVTMNMRTPPSDDFRKLRLISGVLPELKAEVRRRGEIYPNRDCTYSTLLVHYRMVENDVQAIKRYEAKLNRRRSKRRGRRTPLRERRDVTRGHGTQARGRKAGRRGRKTRQAQEG